MGGERDGGRRWKRERQKEEVGEKMGRGGGRKRIWGCEGRVTERVLDMTGGCEKERVRYD